MRLCQASNHWAPCSLFKKSTRVARLKRHTSVLDEVKTVQKGRDASTFGQKIKSAGEDHFFRRVKKSTRV